ncbi:MAG: hypothetical protein HQM02_01635 [Magnetococcales bacterium]|nr:hypothetical protein [Magnetococcales bacterium]
MMGGPRWWGVVAGVWWIALAAGPGAAQPKVYRQPAYITNAYFSDKMSQKGETVHPLSVVKALQIRSNGVLGYFVLDLVLTAGGMHRFKVDILDQTGKAATALQFPPVQVQKKDLLPVYTAAGAISSELDSGLWFFKVYDQVNKGDWNLLGTFSVMVMDPRKD